MTVFHLPSSVTLSGPQELWISRMSIPPESQPYLRITTAMDQYSYRAIDYYSLANTLKNNHKTIFVMLLPGDNGCSEKATEGKANKN